MADETPIEDDVKKKVSMRPPNRRRYEELLDQHLLSIRSLEAELKSYGRPQQGDETSKDTEQRDLLLTEQKRLREEKDAGISKRKSLDDCLKTINEAISKQSDALSKLDAGLAFKTEAAVDDAIRKLEYQLATRHFKLSEENRFVKEIDSLRRSKKKVKEFQQQKQQIDAQRAKKNAMKDDRNKYFRLVSSLKVKEDEVKQQTMKNKSKTDEAWSRYREAGPKREALKKEIDELYEHRRLLTAEFRQQNSKYHIQQKQQRADSFRRKEEEKRSQEIARKKQWHDYEASRDPHEDERQLCSALIRYLQRYLSPDQDLPLGASALSPVQSPTASASFPLSGREDAEYVILKKKTDINDDVFLSATSTKKKRAIRKHNRKSSWLSKPIRHTAQIFSQFETLDLRAPSMVSEVPDAIDQITAKKDEYEGTSKDTKPVNRIPSRAMASPSATTPITASALDQDATSDTEPSDLQHVLTNNAHDDADSDCIHFSLMKLDSKLPRIDIQSARSVQQQGNTIPGSESAPETPNSHDSESGAHREGDQESVDSGIVIQRSKCFTSTASSTRASQDLKCSDTNANTTTHNMHEHSDHQGLDAQLSATTQDALLLSHPIDGYVKESMVSILREKPAQFSHDNDLILEDAL